MFEYHRAEVDIRQTHLPGSQRSLQIDGYTSQAHAEHQKSLIVRAEVIGLVGRKPATLRHSRVD